MWKSIALGAVCLFAFCNSAFAQICSGATYTNLANGNVADASQVMNNFTCVLSKPAFSGPVGVGMSPSYPLDVSASGTTVAQFSSANSASNGGGIRVSASGTTELWVGYYGFPSNMGASLSDAGIGARGYLLLDGPSGTKIGENGPPRRT